MSKVKLEKQEILVGSSRLTGSKNRSFDRVNYMVQNMEFNKAYVHKISENENKNHSKKILEDLRSKYIKYRKSWTEIGKNYNSKQDIGSKLKNFTQITL